jgi:hypothetical protein
MEATQSVEQPGFFHSLSGSPVTAGTLRVRRWGDYSLALVHFFTNHFSTNPLSLFLTFSLFTSSLAHCSLFPVPCFCVPNHIQHKFPPLRGVIARIKSLCSFLFRARKCLLRDLRVNGAGIRGKTVFNYGRVMGQRPGRRGRRRAPRLPGSFSPCTSTRVVLVSCRSGRRSD